MKNAFFLILVLLLSPITILYAQENFRPGYVITNENDTIYGIINFRTAEQNARVCSF